METNPRFKIEPAEPAEPDEGIYVLNGSWLRVCEEYEYGGGTKLVVDGILAETRIAGSTDRPITYQRMSTQRATDKVLRSLTPAHRVPPEAMSEFGHTHQKCVWCGNSLTLDHPLRSKKIGFHDWCAGRMRVSIDRGCPTTPTS